LAILSWKWLDDWDTGTGALLALVAVGGVVYAVGRHALFRTFCAGVVACIILDATWGWSIDYDFLNIDSAYLSSAYWHLGLLAVGAILCLGLALRGKRWTVLLPMAWALAILAQCIAWFAPSHGEQGDLLTWSSADFEV